MIVLDRDAVEAALLDAGLETSALYEDYSGRAMYGAKCFGITGSLSDLLKFVADGAPFKMTDRVWEFVR